MKRVVRVSGQGKVKDVGLRGLATVPTAEDVDSTVALTQALIPVGLQAVGEVLEAEVTALAGEWYRRTGGQPGLVRWSQERGSVYLADQKLPITDTRGRDLPGTREVPLVTYQRLQEPRQADRGVLLRVRRGLRRRAYRECAEAVPAAFGLSASSLLAPLHPGERPPAPAALRAPAGRLRPRGPGARRDDLRGGRDGPRAGDHPDG